MRSIRSACLSVVVVLVTSALACGTPGTTNIANPTSDGSKAKPPEEPAPVRLARIEHGLVPEVRVKGERAGKSIEEELRAHHTPGISIAIIHDHRIVSAKAYGVADVATRTPLTETTLMQAASVSKMFTGVAALKEVEAGKMSLDTNVNQTLRSWHIAENEFTRTTPVTLKHLLSHSAGTNVPTLLQDERQQPTTLEVLEGKAPAINRPVRVEAAPGTKFRYSGGGITVIQQMLIDVEGGGNRSFPDIMNAVVFTPLKLTHSTFELPQKSATRAVSTGHDFDETVVSGIQPWVGGGGSGLWSTPTDIAQLLVEVQLGLRGRSAVVSKELATRLTSTVISTSKDDIITTTMGAFAEKHGRSVYFGHDGHGIGFMTISRASTTSGDGAVIMANGAAATPVMLEILRSIAVEYAWDGWMAPPIDVAPLIDPAHLASLGGRYGKEKTESLFVTVKGDHLEARQPFRAARELLPLAGSQDVFISRSDATKFTFVPAKDSTGSGGTNTGMSLMRAPPPWPPAPPSASVTLTRLPDSTLPEPLQLLEGGRQEEALAASKKLLEANPKDPTLDEGQIRSIGEDLLDELDAKRGLAVLELNLALHPESPMACIDVAEALLRSGRRAEAVPLYAKGRTLFTGATEAAMSEYARANFLWRASRLRTLETNAARAGVGP